MPTFVERIVREWLCDHCEKVFDNEVHALRHERLQHGIDVNKTASGSLQGTKTNIFIARKNVKESPKDIVQDGNKTLPDALAILRSFLERHTRVQQHVSESKGKSPDDTIDVDALPTTKCAIAVSPPLFDVGNVELDKMNVDSSEEDTMTMQRSSPTEDIVELSDADSEGANDTRAFSTPHEDINGLLRSFCNSRRILCRRDVLW